MNQTEKYLTNPYNTGTTPPLRIPWVLVSALGQREGEGAGLLGLGVCRGLMEEFRLFRTALGVAELVRV